MIAQLIQDFSINSNIKSKFVLLYFRLCQLIVKSRVSMILFFPVLLGYRVLIEWFLGVELNWRLKIGPVRLFHGQGLVINPGATFGSACTLRCNTVIGNKTQSDGRNSGCPTIGNNVDIGANCCIIGEITIGNDVTIGAGSVVVKSIPSSCIIVGNPARILRFSKDE
jgi:putative colanic acid biosynthesis acetyltransferase WcaB